MCKFDNKYNIFYIDLRLEQGYIQKCCDIQGVVVETASSSKKKPEMTLVGLYKLYIKYVFFIIVFLKYFIIAYIYTL